MKSSTDGKLICTEGSIHALSPVKIPVPGNKIIEEYIGLQNSGTSQFSVARMVAPPGWEEPEQKPEFDEVTIVIRGRMQAEVDGKLVKIEANQPFVARKNCTVRYSNPFDEEAEYWAVCVPAFSPDTVNRSET
ncbi:cupin domain-containing protein [Rhodohalobacter mucosus]|uniref:Cupin n=1 Tax=Rhodohalobacter mucosus TaxID=2079485 RepID=A0A316TU35_9BACT|nr:cupin [Rhodohalobacter mucosus]PWN07930.1 cupin [Rhodohalobacter mucosus]